MGTVVTVFVNWILWPFVARHELRRALSSMIFFMSIMYRSKGSHGAHTKERQLTILGVVARYVYFEEGREPTEEDVQRSVMLEGHLREGFVRIRQLLVSSSLSSCGGTPSLTILYRSLPDMNFASAHPLTPSRTPPSPRHVSISSSTSSPSGNLPSITSQVLSATVQKRRKGFSAIVVMPLLQSWGISTPLPVLSAPSAQSL